MDCLPSRGKMLDYSERWGIEPMFSDFKSRGFELEDSKLRLADRLERRGLIRALAMYWCVCVGRTELLNHPMPLEKKTREQTNTEHWSIKKLYRSLVSLFKRGCNVFVSSASLHNGCRIAGNYSNGSGAAGCILDNRF